MRSFSEVVFSNLINVDDSIIGKFSRILQTAVDSEMAEEDEKLERLAREEPNHPYLTELRELTLGDLWQVREMGSAFLLLALFQNCETSITHCLDEVFRAWPAETEEEERERQRDEGHRKGPVFKRLAKVVPDYEQLEGFVSFHELMLLVIAWKHEGAVSEKLATHFPRWEAFRPLDGLEEHYDRLKPGTFEFCRNVGERLHQRWLALYERSREA